MASSAPSKSVARSMRASTGTVEAHMQRSGIVAQHDRAAAPQDHAAGPDRDLVDDLLGLLLEEMVGSVQRGRSTAARRPARARHRVRRRLWPGWRAHVRSRGCVARREPSPRPSAPRAPRRPRRGWPGRGRGRRAASATCGPMMLPPEPNEADRVTTIVMAAVCHRRSRSGARDSVDELSHTDRASALGPSPGAHRRWRSRRWWPRWSPGSRRGS